MVRILWFSGRDSLAGLMAGNTSSRHNFQESEIIHMHLPRWCREFNEYEVIPIVINGSSIRGVLHKGSMHKPRWLGK